MSENPLYIEVILDDGQYSRISPQALDALLKRKRVRKFHRAEGWAEVGRSPLRSKHGNPFYAGPERRH
ncbi:MAG: hypothetical protein R6V08_06265 [Desulfuromonadales bacterium]